MAMLKAKSESNKFHATTQRRNVKPKKDLFKSFALRRCGVA